MFSGRPGVALQVQGLSQVYLSATDDGRLDCCDGGAAGDVFTPCVYERGAGEQLLAQEAERRSHRLLFPVQNSSKRKWNI